MDCSPPGSTLHGILNWSELPCLPPGDLPDSGVESMSPASSAFQADSLSLTHQGSPHIYIYKLHYYSCFILTLTLQTNSVTMGFYVCNYYHLDAEIPPMMSQSSSVTNFKPYLSYCYSEPELSQDLDYLYSLQASDKLLPIIQADSSSPFLKITTHGDLVYLLHSHSHFSADHFGNPDFT